MGLCSSQNNSISKIYRSIRCPDHMGTRLILKQKNQKQTCRKCQSSERVFKCYYCAFNICIRCYSKPKEYFRFYCSLGHELIFQGNLGNHCCNMCQNNIDASYTCRKCEIDLCQKCKKNSIDKFASVSAKCINQHKKIQLIYEDLLGKCSECNQFKFGIWTCRSCSFKRCFECKLEIEEKS